MKDVWRHNYDNVGNCSAYDDVLCYNGLFTACKQSGIRALSCALHNTVQYYSRCDFCLN